MNTNMETEDSAASTVTRLWFGQQGNHDSIPIRTDFSLLQGIKTGYGANPRIQFHGHQGLLPKGQSRPEHSADNAPPSSAQITNKWHYTSIQYVFLWHAQEQLYV